MTIRTLIALFALLSMPVFSHADQALSDVPNPYTNMSDGEFALLQELGARLDIESYQGFELAQAQMHGGRYGERRYLSLRESFAQAASTLTGILKSQPIDIMQVHITLKSLKTIVLDVDDVFVYNPGYANQLRGWNECKRILRRMDALVYREGGLRRFERIWDSNQFLQDVGKFFRVSGALSKMDDEMHRTRATEPMDTLVGRHGGKRKATHVWTMPAGTYRGPSANHSSAFNEGVNQF